MTISAQPDFAQRFNARRAAIRRLSVLGYPDVNSAAEGRDYLVTQAQSGRWVFQTLWRPPAVTRRDLRQNLGDSVAQAAHR